MDIANPWLGLPAQSPYVLREDDAAVRAHNAERREEFQFQTDLLPEPFMGRPDAQVVLLNLNPGYDERDRVQYATTKRQNMLRRSLTHSLTERDAFYYLTDHFADTSGWEWWKQRLGPVVNEVGLEAINRGVQVIEYLPYKSRSFYDLPAALPSQSYTFALARDAVKREALIVVLRSFKRWVEAVPELDGSRIHRLNSAQNVTISAKNCPTGFDDIVSLLSA